jgi:hypothetical protein
MILTEAAPAARQSSQCAWSPVSTQERWLPPASLYGPRIPMPALTEAIRQELRRLQLHPSQSLQYLPPTATPSSAVITVICLLSLDALRTNGSRTIVEHICNSGCSILPSLHLATTSDVILVSPWRGRQAAQALHTALLYRPQHNVSVFHVCGFLKASLQLLLTSSTDRQWLTPTDQQYLFRSSWLHRT